MGNDNRKWLYDSLKGKGYNLGSYEEYESNISNAESKKWLYDNATKAGYKVGSFEEFDKAIGGIPPQNTNEYESVSNQVVEEYEKANLPQSELSPYVRGKGPDVEIFGVPFTEYKKMPAQDQSRVYSEAIERKKQEEKNQFSNYISSQLGEIDGELSQRRENIAPAAGSAFIPSSAVSAAQRFGNSDNKEMQDRYTSLHAAKNLLDDANKLAEEAKKGDTGFFSSLGRGFKDKFVDMDNWTMGLTDTAYSGLLRKAVEKEERNEELSPEEGQLLDAATVNMATQAYFSSEMSRGYKAGTMTAESIPFMLEFAVNPISSTGNALAKGLLKHGLKKFGRVATSNAAKVAGRLAGDAVAAAGMTATTGLGRVAAGVNERMIGDIQSTVEDGEIKYDGRENGMDAGEAIVKSAASNFLENQSEMVFNAFDGGGKMAKEALAKFAPGFSKLSNSEIAQFIGKISNNPTVKNIAKRTQFHGILGEYAEEVYNNFANIPLGEMSVEQATDLDQNIDTFLGLAPTSVAFGALGLGGMARESYTSKRNLRRFTDGLSQEDKEIFRELNQYINDGSNEIAKSFIKRTLDDEDLTPEQKKERVFAVQDIERTKAIESVLQESPTSIPEEIEANKVDVYRNYKRAERKLNNLVPAEIIPQLDSVMDVELFAHDNNLNDNQAMAVADYLSAKQPFNQYVEQTNQHREETKALAKERAMADVEKISNLETGFVSQVKHKFSEAPVYLVGGQLSFGEDGLLDRDNSSPTVYYVDENGERQMANSEDFDRVLNETAIPDMITQAEMDAENDFVASEEESLRTPDIPAPTKWEVFMMNGSKYLVEGDNTDNPGQSIMAIKLNDEGEIDIDNGDERPVNLDEYYSLREAELWGEPNNPISQNNSLSQIPSKVLEDGHLAVPSAITENEVVYDVLDANGNIADSGMMPPEEFNSLTDYASEQEEELNDDGTLINPLSNNNLSENQSPNEATPSVEKNKTIENQPLAEETPIIPSDDKGNLLYHKAPVNVTIDSFYREELEPEEIDSFVQANKDASTKLLSTLEEKGPKIGTNIAKYKADKLAWKEKLSDAKEQVAYWNSVSEDVVASRVQPGDKTAEAILSMGEPMTGRELAATMLGTGRLPVLYDSYKKETGGRNTEARGMVGLFVSKANGGMTIEEAGEQLMLADQENGTNFFNQDDPNAGRNAIIDVLSGSRTRGDLFGYIKNNREVMAERERQAEYDAYSSWTEENFGMTPDNYESYEEQAPASVAERFKDFDEEEFYNNIANELDEEQGEITGTTASSEILQGEGFVSPERTETSENKGGAIPISTESGIPDGVILEETSVINQGFGENEILNADSNFASLPNDNQIVNENSEVPESISQGEHGAFPEEYDRIEEALSECRRRSSQDERYAQADSGTLPEREQKEIENKAAEDYAKENGSWIPMQDVLSLGVSVPSGNENDVYLDTKGNSVFKVNNLMNSGNITSLLERIKLHNEYFPQTKYELAGFSGSGTGDVFPVLKQGYVENATEASPDEIGSYMQALGFNPTGEASYSNGDVTISDLRPRNVLKDADGEIYVINADLKKGTSTFIDKTDSTESPKSLQENAALLQDVTDSGNKQEKRSFIAPTLSEGEDVLSYASRIAESKQLFDAEQEVNSAPTEAQKEAGNYKKGHVKVDSYNISIENPKGSERSGMDTNGQPWSVTMNNSYGYIRETEGADGDHIDVFLSENPSLGNVFVVDQVKEDGSFDEHKVMYGFSSVHDAKEAYLSNYSPGWKGLGNITEVSKDEFKKWVDSSKKKTKAFAEYNGVKVKVSNEEASGNTLVSDERYAELRERMRKKLGGQMNLGVDPEILAIGTEMAIYHIEKGTRRFADFSKAMIEDLGDAIRPYLKSFYNGARELPEVESAGYVPEMDKYEDVRSFDVANMGKVMDVIAMAEEIAKEQDVLKQEKTAKEKIKTQRQKQKDAGKSVSLFEGLFNENQEKDEGRNQTTNRELGEETREETQRTNSRGNHRSLHGDNVPDSDGSGRVSSSNGVERSVKRNQNNFSFGSNHIDVPSGDTAKLKANVEAIRTLKEVEENGLPATKEQKEKLARYVGWGGLANALDSDKYESRNRVYSQSHDKIWNDKYLPYYEQLKGLLSVEEFKSAVQSTTTSHYTPEQIIRELWTIIKRLGFKGGVISEPAMGIGHIVGLMPEYISSKSRINGFEIDHISGRISTVLYPDANVKVQGYETEFMPQSKDLVITNVPFGKTAPYDKALDKPFKKKLGSSYNLHNYFILKGLLELKEGGFGVFVTSSATMDGADSRFREYVSSNGFDLIGAIRLPNDAFQKNAGTSVTADILMFRKRKAGESSNAIKFTSTTQYGEGSYEENGEIRTKPIMVNEYFSLNPNMMLGDMMTAYDAGSGGLYSGASQTLKARDADFSQLLAVAIESLPKDIISEVSSKIEAKETTDARSGTIVEKEGKIFVSMNGELEPISIKETFSFGGKTRKTIEAISEYNEIKETLHSLIAAEQSSDIDPEPIRRKLNQKYDVFVSKYGTLNRNKILDDVFAEDFEHNLPLSLEDVRRVPSPTGRSMVYEVSKGRGIFDKRISFPVEEPTNAESLQDAISISLSYRGIIDIPFVSGLTRNNEEDVIDDMLRGGIAYRDPLTGALIDKESYLSGNVREKLEVARAISETNPDFQKNVDELSKVQPETIRFGDISYRLGTPWIPTEHINRFAEEVLGVTNAQVEYVSLLNEFVIGKTARVGDFAKSGLFRTERLGIIDLFSAALNQRKPKVFDERTEYGESGMKKVRVPNEVETQAVAEKIMEISDKFIEYIGERKDIHRELERIYNDKYNNYRLKEHGLPTFEYYPNANREITLRTHQKKAVQRSLSESTLLAHQVGTGKTFTMITSAMEMRRLGIAKKPMIVVQNATLEDFVKDFYKLYPGANVLAPGKDERSAENRKRLFNLIATGDFDAIVIPQSFMQFIPDDEGRKKEFINKRIEQYEQILSSIDDYALRKRLEKEVEGMRDSLEGLEKGKKRSVKDKAKAADRIKNKIERQLDRRTDDGITFEQMGVDALFIDEAHNFKKIGFASKMSNIKGIDTSASQRANSLLLKAQFVQEKNGGRNVTLATGTPITNTMAEVWTMMNFVAPDILESYSIQSFDDFATTFGTVEPSLEFTATGSFKIADRFKSYVNVPELVKAFRSHADVVLTEDIQEFKEDNNIPKLKDGQMTNVVIDKNEDLEDVMQILINRLEEYNNMTGKEKKKWSALPLVVFTKAKQAAIDLRLLNPSYSDNPNSKTNQVVSNVVRLYKESSSDKGAQLVFCDSYQSPDEQPKMDLFDYNADNPRFNLYEDIKKKLIKHGVPSEEIAIVNNYEGERRKVLFEKVRNGDVRVLLGSTEKMGVGVNVQDRLYALHHIDAPIRPMDFEQRNGRILRQGNLHAAWGKPVNVVTYGVQGTLDATAYDRLRIKQNFINQMMKGDVSGRIMEEQDDEDPSGMTFNQMAATLSGDKTAQLLFVAENKLKKLKNLRRSDINSKSGMADAIETSHNRIRLLEDKKSVYERANQVLEKYFPNGIESIEVNGKTIVEKFGSAISPVISNYDDAYSLNRGTAPLKFALNNEKATVVVHFNEGRMVYELYAGNEHIVEGRQFNGGVGLISSMEHQIKATKGNLADAVAEIYSNERKIAGLQEAMNSPWGREVELTEAQSDVDSLKKQLEEKAQSNTSKSEKRFRIDDENSFDVDGVVSAFKERVKNHPDIYQITSIEDAQKLKKEGVTDAVISTIIKDLDNKNLTGVYYPKRKMMIVYPANIHDNSELEKALWHESVHYILNTSNILNKDQLLESCLKYVKNNCLDIYNRAISGYSNEEHTEESVTYFMEYLLEKYGAERLINSKFEGDSDLANLFTQLINNLKDENGRERNQLRQNGTTSTLGEGTEAYGRESESRSRTLKDDSRVGRKGESGISRSEEEIASSIVELSTALHSKVHIIRNVDEVTDQAIRDSIEKGRKVKGWFDTKTGEIAIYLPNAESVEDAQSTILHEAVAHEGLSNVFGEAYDEFIDKVFENSSVEVRGEIIKLGMKRGYDFHLATEEYLASLAELGFEKNKGIIDTAKRFFKNMLHRFKIKLGFILNESDLRYMLWRTYQLKTDGHSMEGLIGDIAMRYTLKVGNHRETPVRKKFREDDSTAEKDVAKHLYEAKNRAKMYKRQEAYQDSMLGLKILQEALESETKKPIEDHENAYISENQLSSRNSFEEEFYKTNFFDPMFKEVNALIKKGSSYEDILRYMKAKHGLERNEEFTRRAQEKAKEPYMDQISELENLLDEGLIEQESFSEKRDELTLQMNKAAEDAYFTAMGKDFSGLTSLSNAELFKEEAERIVSEFEEQYETTALWNKTNEATKESLRKSYDCGLLTKSVYDKVKDMFKYYIPLRGWKEDTAADVYDYIMEERPIFNPSVKTMEGRISEADDPLATIFNMAESSIMQGNRNLMKQRFLAMVINHPTSLATVKQMWYVHDPVSGGWTQAIPEIPDDAPSEAIPGIITEFERRMKELQLQKLARKGKLDVPYKALPREKLQHMVVVKKAGVEYTVYVNGNPRAAQAVNGLINQDAGSYKIVELTKKVHRQMAANFTTRNPAFVVTNLARDLIFSATAVTIKEDSAYSKKFRGNLLRNGLGLKLGDLLYKLKKNSLDMNNEVERYFSEFLQNGGETGYTALHSVEEHKKMIERSIIEAKGLVDLGRIFGLPPGKVTSPTTLGVVPAFRFVAKWTGFGNRCAEDTSRFTTYMTSRQMGRSISRSINDAKEVTVNFNKKGAGGMGATTFKTLFLFFNAAVQSLFNFYRLSKVNPKRFSGAISIFAAAGILLPIMNNMLIGLWGGDDDKDAYENLPEWIRKNNFCFWLGGDRFLTIPIPIELRAFYGAGELFRSYLDGRGDNRNIGMELFGQFSELLPINPFGGGEWNITKGTPVNEVTMAILSNVMPDVGKPGLQVLRNKDFFGKPIYKDKFNELMPEWTKAYAGTSTQLVSSAEFLNEISGGDKYTRGTININPAILEHFFESYFGGLGKTINQTGKTISMIWEDDQRMWRNVPVLNRFFNGGDERNLFGRVNEAYYNYLGEFKVVENKLRGYQKEKSTEYKKKLRSLKESAEYERYLILKSYQNKIKDYQEVIKEETDKESMKNMEIGLSLLKSEIIEKLRETE